MNNIPYFYIDMTKLHLQGKVKVLNLLIELGFDIPTYNDDITAITNVNFCGEATDRLFFFHEALDKHQYAVLCKHEKTLENLQYLIEVKKRHGLTLNICKEGPEGSVSADLKDTNPKSGEGTKKIPMSSVPAIVISEVAVALFEGNCKYGRYNYRESGAKASVYYDSTWRHLSAWWEGQDIDPASGIHHITKAISGLIVLRDCMLRDNMTDDRPPASKEYEKEMNSLVEGILERYGHIKPKHVTNLNFEDKFNDLHK